MKTQGKTCQFTSLLLPTFFWALPIMDINKDNRTVISAGHPPQVWNTIKKVIWQEKQEEELPRAAVIHFRQKNTYMYMYTLPCTSSKGWFLLKLNPINSSAFLPKKKAAFWAIYAPFTLILTQIKIWDKSSALQKLILSLYPKYAQTPPLQTRQKTGGWQYSISSMCQTLMVKLSMRQSGYSSASL